MQGEVSALLLPGSPPLQAPGVHAGGQQGQAGGLPLLRSQQGELVPGAPSCAGPQSSTTPCPPPYTTHTRIHTCTQHATPPQSRKPHSSVPSYTLSILHTHPVQIQDLIIPPMASPMKYPRSPLLGAPSRNRTILGFFKGGSVTRVGMNKGGPFARTPQGHSQPAGARLARPARCRDTGSDQPPH